MQAILAANQTLVDTVPALAAQQAELNDSITLIDNISQAQSSPTSGIALDKEQVLELMIRKTLQVAGMLRAYASTIGDQTLLKKAQVSRNTFHNARDEAKDDIAQETHDLANTHRVALAPSGLTDATLTALSTRVNVYKLATPSTRAAEAHGSTLTENLEAELKRADMIQRERLDGLMEQFSDTQPTFYGDYKNARKLVNARGPGKAEPENPTPP